MHLLLRATLVTLLLSVSACSTQTVKNENSDIKEALSLIKADELLEQLPAIIKASVDQSPDIEAAKKEQLGNTLANAFQSSITMPNVISYLEKDYNPDRYLKVKALLGSDIQQKMLKYEMAAAQPEYYQQLAEYLGTFEKDPPQQERVQLMQQLIEASNSVEANVTVQLGFLKGMMRAAIMMDPPEQRMSVEDQKSTFTMLEQQLTKATLQQELASNLFMYREVSNEDIAAYIEFYRKPDMSWFLDVYVKAIAFSFEAAGQQAAQSLAKMSDKS